MAIATTRRRAGGGGGAAGSGARSAAGKRVGVSGANGSNGAGGGSSGGSASLPPFIDRDVNLLLARLTSPETPVKYDPPSRSTPGTIQTTINPSQTTWTWRNITARIGQPVLPGDVNKIGYQSDIDTYYLLASAEPPEWKQVPNPTGTSRPFEISTGAADADSFHDFYRLRIAFEDVWSELLDNGIAPMAQRLYAMWDALMDVDPTKYDDTGAADRLKRFLPNFFEYADWEFADVTARMNANVRPQEVGLVGHEFRLRHLLYLGKRGPSGMGAGAKAAV